MLFLKQMGFLLLMAVLGIVSLVAHELGYPLAWEFYSGQPYWMPLISIINAVLVAAAVAAVFWLLRGFLFGRGRPYLAWFAMACWALVWAGVSWHAAATHKAHWPPLWHVGIDSLQPRAEAANQVADLLAVAQEQSADKREVICTQAFLEEEHTTNILRDGIPVAVQWPKNLAEKKLFEGSVCSDDMKEKHQKYAALQQEIKKIVQPDDLEHRSEVMGAIEDLMQTRASVTLMTHPDTVAALVDAIKKSKQDPVAGQIARAEAELRIYSNGQMKDHEWVLRGTDLDKDTKAVYINPRIWSADSGDKPEDVWYAWTKSVKTNGTDFMLLKTYHCANKTVEYELSLRKNKNGQLKLEAVNDEPDKVKKDSWGEDWLNFVCASKDKLK